MYNFKQPNLCVIGVSKGEEKEERAEKKISLFKEIRTKICPGLIKTIIFKIKTI